jgi:glutaredoxin
MKDWKIVVYGIEGCEYCRELKNGLGVMNIPFTYINISDNDELGDKIEDLFQCLVYPMVALNSPQKIVWLPGTSLLPSNTIRIFDTIQELLTNIKEIYES